MKIGVKFSQSDNIVYSTQLGELCSACSQPKKECICRQIKKATIPQGDGIVRVSRQTQGRHGKCVSVISGILVNAEQLKQLATKLKKQCGTGGTTKDGTIEIQGDHRPTLVAALTKMGFKTKLAGG
jgi:translation initiation factor 1